MNRHDHQASTDGFVPVCNQKCYSLEYRLDSPIVIVGFSGVACVIVAYFTLLQSHVVLFTSFLPASH
jgi:hypothetical protein